MKKFLKNKVLLISLIGCILISGLAAFIFINNKSNTASAENNVPIAMAADDNYTYPTIVSITSMMTNANKNTNYDIYIMTPGEFNKDNKDKILSLQEKYNNCKITLIDMKDRYKNANDRGHITTPSYYRLSLASLLPKLNKIIWLDGDTLIFGDLKELLDRNMGDNYYEGFLDPNVNGTKDFGVDNDHYICSGVMLLNLEKLRADNIEDKFEKFIEENNERLVQHDQTVINTVCADNIGFFPAKYGMFNFKDEEAVRWYWAQLIAKNHYTESEVIDAYNNPVILHYVNKPWKYVDFNKQADIWWKYAEKTGFINEIKEKYGLS